MSENDYRSFITDFSIMLNEQKKYLNEVVFRGGIPFPYDVPEFYTTVQFRPDVMYFILVVEDEYAVYQREYEEIDYFEDWDEDEWEYHE